MQLSTPGMQRLRTTVLGPHAISILLSTLIALLFGEILVRLSGHQDELQQYHVADRLIPPCAPLDINALREHVDAYQHDSPFLVYNALIGWEIGHNAVSQEGYRGNNDGLRSHLEYNPEAEDSVIRIGVFGDSFTFGTDATYKESWPYLAQERLNAAGYETQLINFGVPAYGMDQAYLRYLTKGTLYNLDVVIFGLNPENANRNVNMLSPLYFGVSLPFSKSRFILENNKLALINTPAVPPAALAETLASFTDTSLVDYEAFYQPRQHDSHLWKSRLAAFVSTFFGVKCGKRAFSSTPLFDAQQSLSDNIVHEFGQSVSEYSTQFIVLEIPLIDSVQAVIAGNTPIFDEFYMTLANTYPVIRTVEAFSQDNYRQYFSKSSHHSPLGQSLLAEIVVDYLIRTNKMRK